jgi:hypothetical protein
MRNFELMAQIDRYNPSKALQWTLVVENDNRNKLRN